MPKGESRNLKKPKCRNITRNYFIITKVCRLWYTIIKYNEIGVPASASLKARARGPADLIALTQININKMLRCLDPLNCKPIFGPLVSAFNTRPQNVLSNAFLHRKLKGALQLVKCDKNIFTQIFKKATAFCITNIIFLNYEVVQLNIF